MKKSIFALISTLILLLSVSCSCSRGIRHEGKEPDAMPGFYRVDTVFIVDSAALIGYQDSIRILKDSVKYYRDSVEYENYINARRIEKIKYYINICEKKTTNKKYFFGWIRRAVTE